METDRNVRGLILRYYAFNLFSSMLIVFSVMTQFYKERGNLGPLEIFLVQAWFLAWNTILEIPTGGLADRFGRKKALVIGSGLYVLGVAAYGSVANIYAFLAGEFIMALASRSINGADTALLSIHLQEAYKDNPGKFKEVNSHVRSYTSIFRRVGSILSAAIVFALNGSISLNAIMLLSVLPFLLSGCIAVGFKEVPIPEKHLQKNYWQIIKGGYITLKENRFVRMIMFNSMVVSPAGYGVLWMYQLYMDHLHIETKWYTGAYVLVALVQIVSARFYKKIVQWCGNERRYFKLTAYIASAGYLFVFLYPGIVSLVVFITLVSAASLTRTDLLGMYMEQHVDKDIRTTVKSYVDAMRSILQLCINIALGVIMTHAFYWSFLFIALFPLCTIFFPIVDELFEAKK